MASSAGRAFAKILPSATVLGIAVTLALVQQMSLGLAVLLAALEVIAATLYGFQWLHSDLLEKLRPKKRRRTAKNPEPSSLIAPAQVRRYLILRWAPIACLTALLAICEFHTYGIYQERKIEGDLIGARTAPLQNVGSGWVPWVQVGPTGTILATTRTLGGHLILAPFPDAEFEIEPGAIAPLVSTTIRDRNGDLVATIRRNHWQITTASLDRNFSPSAFEVIDKAGHILFQLWLEKGTTRWVVHVQGEWWNVEERGWRVVEKPERQASIIPMTKDRETTEDLISPIFAYPSRDHLGEMKKTK